MKYTPIKSKRIYIVVSLIILLIGLPKTYSWLETVNQGINESSLYITSFLNGQIKLTRKENVLIDTNSKHIITSNALSVLANKSEVYVLGKGEYVVYNTTDGIKRVYQVNSHQKKESIRYLDYTEAKAIYVPSYLSFTQEEKMNFQKMLTADHRGLAVYYKPFYCSPYNGIIIDTSTGIYIGVAKAWKVYGHVFYSYGDNNFIIINSNGLIRQYYNSLIFLNANYANDRQKINNSIVEKKRIYGNKYEALDNLNSLSETEKEVLHEIWEIFYLTHTAPYNREEKRERLDNIWGCINNE